MGKYMSDFYTSNAYVSVQNANNYFSVTSTVKSGILTVMR